MGRLLKRLKIKGIYSKIIMIQIKAIIIFLLTIAQANATTYYLDATSGNDNNSGASASNAWKSLPKISAQVLKSGIVR